MVRASAEEGGGGGGVGGQEKELDIHLHLSLSLCPCYEVESAADDLVYLDTEFQKLEKRLKINK